MNETINPQPAAPSEDEQLKWTLLRLGQMQGARMDMQQLVHAMASLTAFDSLKVLNGVSKNLSIPSPKFLRRPDRALLPLVAHTQEFGWGVVVDRDAKGKWVLVTPTGQQALSEGELIKRCAHLQVRPPTSLGFGIWGGGTPKEPGFFSHVKATIGLYRSEIIESCLASAFIGLLAMVTSLFSMQVYDRVIPTRSEYTLIILAIGVLLSILIELAMKYARSNVMEYVTVGMDSRLSREVFDRLLRLRVDQLPPSVGSLAAQIRGYEQVRGFYTASTLFTLIDLPMALIFIVVVASISTPLVAGVPLVFAAAAIALGFSIRRRIMRQAKEGAALSNLKTGLLVEAVEGIETIKAGSGGWKFLSRWIGVNSQTIHNDLAMRHLQESVGYMAASIQQISYACMVVVGAVAVMQGHMTTGALIACSILSGRILQPVMALPGLLVQHAHAQAALDGLERLYHLKTDYADVETPIAPEQLMGHFVLNDVKFAYGQNPPAIVIQRLEIHPGERVAVLGPIGAGKSSLVRLLSGLYHPSSGRVLVDNLDLSHVSRQVLNQHIGYLQQDHRLFQGSLRENLLIGLPDPGDEAIVQAMRRTGMDRMVAAHPRGLELPIMEGGKGLSGGQKQLVAFTRLVLCNPNIYLLDEPTASMDDDQERRCLNVLHQEAAEGKTMVIVTHKPSILPLATRIVVIAGNQIMMDGPRDRVLAELQSKAAQASQQAAAAQASGAVPHSHSLQGQPV